MGCTKFPQDFIGTCELVIYPLGAVLPLFLFSFSFRLFAFCLVCFFSSILCKQNCKYGDWLNSVYQELWYSVFFVSVHLYPQSLVSFYGRCVHLHAHICLSYSIFRILKQKETGKWLFLTKVVLCPLEKSALWICRKGYFTQIILQSSDKFPSLLKCPSTCLTFFSPFWCSIFFFLFCPFPEHCGPCGLCNHCTHSTGHIPGCICACLHWVCLQEAFTCFLPGHLGLFGCHGLPFYVFWRDHLSVGSGKTRDEISGTFICCRACYMCV